MAQYRIHVTYADGTTTVLTPDNSNAFLQEVEDLAYKVLSGEVKCFTPYIEDSVPAM